MIAEQNGQNAGKPSTDQNGSLVACPFCGGKAGLIKSETYPHTCYVECGSGNCWCSLGEHWDRDGFPDHLFRSEEEAVTAWNQRANT